MFPTSAKHLKSSKDKSSKHKKAGQSASSSSSYIHGVGMVHFDKTNHEEIRPDMIRPEDGPNVGLPSASTMQKLVDRGLVKGEFSAEGKHGGGYFKTIISHTGFFGGWKRTGS
jgi:hypothetical protein